jgi:flagellar FliJ protein
VAQPFTFKLERILDLRTQLEDQARMMLARAQAAHDEQEKSLVRLREALRQHMEKQQEARRSSGELWLWENYRKALENDVAEAQVTLRGLALKLQKARKEALDRSRDRKLLEKLKETQARKHDEEESMREQKENDEMATLRRKPSTLEDPS